MNLQDSNNEMRRTEALENLAEAARELGYGNNRQGGPGVFEFIGMTLRDGVRVQVEGSIGPESVTELSDSLDGIASAIRYLADKLA